MSHLPLPLIALFLLTVLLTFFLLAKAVRGSKAALITSVAWVGLQSGVALSGFYLVTNVLPPRFLLVIAPPLVLLIGLLLIPAGRHFLGGMDLKWSVLFHTIRIFVELNLYWLFLYKQVPALMTFEAGNLDILVGLSAPLAWCSCHAVRAIPIPKARTRSTDNRNPVFSLRSAPGVHRALRHTLSSGCLQEAF
jgi:hypothetical protein